MQRSRFHIDPETGQIINSPSRAVISHKKDWDVFACSICSRAFFEIETLAKHKKEDHEQSSLNQHGSKKVKAEKPPPSRQENLDNSTNPVPLPLLSPVSFIKLEVCPRRLTFSTEAATTSASLIETAVSKPSPLVARKKSTGSKKCLRQSSPKIVTKSKVSKIIVDQHNSEETSMVVGGENRPEVEVSDSSLEIVRPDADSTTLETTQSDAAENPVAGLKSPCKLNEVEDEACKIFLMSLAEQQKHKLEKKSGQSFVELGANAPQEQVGIATNHSLADKSPIERKNLQGSQLNLKEKNPERMHPSSSTLLRKSARRICPSRRLKEMDGAVNLYSSPQQNTEEQLQSTYGLVEGVVIDQLQVDQDDNRMSMMIEHIPASGNPEMPPVTEQTLPSHSNTQQVGCCLCCSVFNCRSDLILHDRTTHMALNKRYKCPYCPKILVTKRNILDHIKQSHQTEYQTFAQGECQVCHKKVLKGNLRRHSFQHIGTSKKPKNN